MVTGTEATEIRTVEMIEGAITTETANQITTTTIGEVLEVSTETTTGIEETTTVIEERGIETIGAETRDGRMRTGMREEETATEIISTDADDA